MLELLPEAVSAVVEDVLGEGEEESAEKNKEEEGEEKGEKLDGGGEEGEGVVDLVEGRVAFAWWSSFSDGDGVRDVQLPVRCQLAAPRFSGSCDLPATRIADRIRVFAPRRELVLTERFVDRAAEGRDVSKEHSYANDSLTESKSTVPGTHPWEGTYPPGS